MPHPSRPIVLTIAGTDPSGGAGIQADIKSISATGCYAASVITALVAQNTCGVQAIHPVPSTFVEKQLASVFQDLNIASVKIGMIYDQSIMHTIAQALDQYRPPCVVIDPVMVAKNGAPLLKLETIGALKTVLFPHATLLTPNIPEAETLLHRAISTRIAMQEAVTELSQQFNTPVLLKGGHLQQDAQASDALYFPENNILHWFEATRIQTHNTHGTGCSLSAAIASYLAKGSDLKSAITEAKHYLTQAIQSGAHQKIGQGSGPIDHFYFIP